MQTKINVACTPDRINKKIFLYDGIGAAISTGFTGLVLPMFSERLGLTHEILYALAFLAFVYMLFSMCIFIFAKFVKAWMLYTIITANLIYCFISTSIIIFYKPITIWGIVVVLFEIVVILGVVAIEVREIKKIMS